MKIKLNSPLQWLARRVLRQAVGISLLGMLLAVVGSYFTFILYKNLHTNIEELLPTSARSVVDLNRLVNQVKSVENLVVLTFCSDPQASKRFVSDLAAELDRLPRNLVSSVEYRIDGEIAFFKKRRALFLDLDDLLKLKTYTQARILFEKDKHGLGLGLVPEPKLDIEFFKRKYASQASFFDRFPDGFYASNDQTKRALIVNLPGKVADIGAAQRLKAAVVQAVAKLRPQSYAHDLEVEYTGNTENLLEEHAALVADLKFSTVVVILLVSGAMWLFYRTFWATAALVVSVLMGTLWTMGAAYFLTGYLNANSAFLASIVIGNGINFGIIFLARYLEERRRGRNHTRALITAIHTTAKSTSVAALAAGISYGSLMLTEFRGFSQFGVIGLSGMLLCWLSAYVLLPSFLTVLEKWRGLLKPGKAIQRRLLAQPIANLVERHPRCIASISLCVTLAAFATFFFHKPEILEMDMNKLRDRQSMRSGSGFYYHYISEIFGRNLSPMVLLPSSRQDARRIVAALRADQQREGAQSQIAWVQTLDDMVPTDQEKKIVVLKQFHEILTPAVLKLLPNEYREVANALVAGGEVTPFREGDLDPMILDRFTEADGQRGRIVLVDKPVVKAGEAESAAVTVRFIHDLRALVDRVSPGTALAGQLPITADMVSAIWRDGPRATLFAGAAVFLLVAVLFHNLRLIALVSFTLWIGIFWFAGLILGFNLKINFLNFIALPITFGIGVDYGVNVFQRYREDGMRSILDAVRHTGAAVALCSMTTVIGYASLILGGNQAFVSFGILAVLGEVCCVTVAVIYLPAYLMTRVRYSHFKEMVSEL